MFRIHTKSEIENLLGQVPKSSKELIQLGRYSLYRVDEKTEKEIYNKNYCAEKARRRINFQ